MEPQMKSNDDRMATCPICFGDLQRVVEGEIGQKLEWIVCGGACRQYFYPPWPEHQWSEPESQPIPAVLASRFGDGDSEKELRQGARAA
jgi:hypothetical protein